MEAQAFAPKTLVISAGGMHAAAYVGALRRIEELFFGMPFRAYHGTSAGALVCAMAASGLTSAEMMNLIETFSEKTHAPCASDVMRVPTDWGALDAERVIGPLLDTFLEPEETFVTLAKRRGVQLSVHAYDVSRGKLVDFGILDTPDMSVRLAVCASCCVPLLFKPIRIGGALYVDGAVSQRTPIHMIRRARGDIKNTLVLDVTESTEHPPLDVWQYISRLTSATSRHIEEIEGVFVTITVPTGSPTLLDLPVPAKSHHAVEACGYDTVCTKLSSFLDKSGVL